MRRGIGLTVGALLAVVGAGCGGTQGAPEVENTSEEHRISEQEQVEFQRCIRERLPAKIPASEAWVVSGSTFVLAFDACSQNLDQERLALFRLVASTMARPDENLTQLIIYETP